jgi:hypothetical protein
MSNINFIFLIPVLIVLITAFYIIVVGKYSVKNRLIKKLIIVFVISILLGTYYIDRYYKQQLKLDEDKLISLFLYNDFNDSLLQDSKWRSRKIDSLEIQNKELKEIFKNIIDNEKIIGRQDKLKQDINNKIESNKTEIGKIIKYNKILENDAANKLEGYLSSGFTSNFIFECPNDYKSDFLDLKLRFKNERIVDEIKFIYISFTEKNNEKEYTLLFEQKYMPQRGINGFKVKNFFKLKKKVNLEIGYILKSESGKTYPNFERVVCKNY